MRRRRQSMRNSTDADMSTESGGHAGPEDAQTLNLLNFVERIKKESVEAAVKQEPQATVGEQLQKPGLVCYLCLAAFDTRTVLASHMGRVHRSKNIEELSALSCPIELCNVVVFSQPQLVVHARSHHSNSKEAADSKFMSYTRVFDDQDKFKKWRNRSLKSVSTMTCDATNQTDQYLETIFHCRPSFAKQNAACPAFSNIRLMKNGKIKITYCLDHLGHSIESQEDFPDSSAGGSVDEEALEVPPDELLNEGSTDSTVGDVLRKRLREGNALEAQSTSAAVLANDKPVTNRPITNSILPQQFTIEQGLFDDVLDDPDKTFAYRDFYNAIWDFFCFIKKQHETITCERLKMSALEIAKRMGLTMFTGNDWWLRSFKRRHKLRFSTMTGEPFDYAEVKEVVLKCEAEDRTVEDVLAEAAEAERQAQKRSVATETSPIPSPNPAVPFANNHVQNDARPSGMATMHPEQNHQNAPGMPSMELWQALTNSCLIPQKREDPDLSWAFEIIRSRVLQQNIHLLPQVTNLQAALALSQPPPVRVPNPAQVVTVLQSVPVTTSVDINGSSNIVLVSQPPHVTEHPPTNHVAEEKETLAPRSKKRKLAGK
uniref:HTH CENPB-type domain-containing protein n=1 Tax=Steinernema glaseri TaxID=37863 RepID=A0A1I8ATT2_9BILA